MDATDLLRQYAEQVTGEDSLRLERQALDLLAFGYSVDELRIVVRPGLDRPTSDVVPASIVE
jgi:hypothetical protein